MQMYSTAETKAAFVAFQSILQSPSSIPLDWDPLISYIDEKKRKTKIILPAWTLLSGLLEHVEPFWRLIRVHLLMAESDGMIMWTFLLKIYAEITQ